MEANPIPTSSTLSTRNLPQHFCRVHFHACAGIEDYQQTNRARAIKFKKCLCGKQPGEKRLRA